MFAPGAPPSSLLTGSIWRNAYDGPPAASIAARSLFHVAVAVTTPLFWFRSREAGLMHLDRDDLGSAQVADDHVRELVELRLGVAHRQVLDVERRHGQVARVRDHSDLAQDRALDE